MGTRCYNGAVWRTGHKSREEGLALQSATGQTKRPGSVGSAQSTRGPVRKNLRPITKVIAGLIALASIGIMVLVLLGFWPPKFSAETATNQSATAVAIRDAGLTVEKAGPITADPQHPGQFIIPVLVKNNVKKSAKLHITPTPGVVVPSPTPAPAAVLNADIRVIFYKREGDERKSVGTVNGNATDIPFGQSKTVQIVGIGIDNPQDLEYDVEIGSMWTDKDAFVTQDAAITIRSAGLPRNP